MPYTSPATLSLDMGTQAIRINGSDSSVYTVTTIDATVQTLTLATFPSVGDAAFIYYTLRGEQDNGERGMRHVAWIDGGRNATGTSGLRTGNIGPTGHTSVAALPWQSTVGVPSGWALVAELDVSGNSLVMSFNAAAGQTVRWSLSLQRILLGGAT